MRENQITAINREIDGLNTPEESAQLRELLAREEDARVYYEELTRLSSLLSLVEPVNPPPELKAGIMKTIHNREAEAAPARPAVDPESVYDGWLNSVFGAFRNRGRFAYAMTFAAGLTVGLIGFMATGDLGNRPEGLSGTMAPAGLTTVDTQNVAQSGVQGTVQTQVADNRLITRLELDSSTSLEVMIEFDGEIFRPAGFEQASPQPAGITAPGILVGPQSATFFHSGQNTYVFTLESATKADSEVLVTFSSEGFEFQKTLRTQVRGK